MLLISIKTRRPPWIWKKYIYPKLMEITYSAVGCHNLQYYNVNGPQDRDWWTREIKEALTLLGWWSHVRLKTNCSRINRILSQESKFYNLNQYILLLCNMLMFPNSNIWTETTCVIEHRAFDCETRSIAFQVH